MTVVVRRKGDQDSNQYILYYIYFRRFRTERRAHGVIVITMHLWGGGDCGVVAVGWHLAHHVVVLALHFCRLTLTQRKWEAKEGQTSVRRRP